MRKIFSALMIGALAVSFTACNGNKPSSTKSVTLDQTAVTLAVGETHQIKATTDPAGQALTYTSQKAEVATVDANGLVTAVADGETIILVKSGDAKATLNVTVGKPGPSSKVPEPDAVEGKYLVIFRFNAEVCNEVVFIGSYNGWTSDPEACVKFEPYLGGEKFGDETFTEADGWMYVLIEDESEAVEGKPVQLKNDGSFSWDFQCGDVDAWTIHTGGLTLEPGYAGECNMKGYTAVTVGEMAYWKNNGTPCETKPEHDYKVTVKVPAICDAEAIVPNVIGDFNGWATGVEMIKVEDGVYTATFHDEEGHSFKVKGSPEGDWSVEIVTLKEDETWGGYDNTVLGAEEEITVDLSDPAKYAWNICQE